MKLTIEQARALGFQVQEVRIPRGIQEAFDDAARRAAAPSPKVPAAQVSEITEDSNASEASEQEAMAAWLDASGARWCHVPNGGHRHAATAAALKAQGVKPGVPDVLIFTPPPAQPEARGVALELKRQSLRPKRPVKSETWPSCVRPEQRDWLVALAAQGWVALVAFGADDAIAQLVELGYGREG